ncbi:MAG: hypothetical protein ACRDQW_01915, partial [Haloechinothrix sp.]
YPDRPLAACAVPPVDLRGDLSHVKTIVDDYHRAGMGTGFPLISSATSCQGRGDRRTLTLLMTCARANWLWQPRSHDSVIARRHQSSARKFDTGAILADEPYSSTPRR